LQERPVFYNPFQSMSDIDTQSRIALLILVLFLLVPTDASFAQPTSDSGKTIPIGTVRKKPDFVDGEILVRYKEEVIHATERVERIRQMRELGEVLKEKFGVQVIATHPSTGVQRVTIPPSESLGTALKRLNNSPLVQYAEPNYKIYPLFDGPPYDEYWIKGPVDLWGMDRIGMKQAWAASGTASIAESIVVAVIDSGVDHTHPDLSGQMWFNPGEISKVQYEDDDGNGIIDDIYGVNYCWLTDDKFGDIQPTGSPRDTSTGHGTAVAGIIAASITDQLEPPFVVFKHLSDKQPLDHPQVESARQPVGSATPSYLANSFVAGVHRKAKLMALKVICTPPNDPEPSTVSSAALAIDYAWQHGAKVINASWYVATGTDRISPVTGQANGSTVLREAIQRARDHGVLLVAAAGNSDAPPKDNDTIAIYPANYGNPSASDYLDNVIAVGATWDQCTDGRAVNVNSTSPNYGKCDNGSVVREALWDQSHFGLNTVPIAAPGWFTRTLMPLPLDSSGTTIPSGTSMAAPHVVGCAALIAAKRAGSSLPTLTPNQLKNVLLGNADSIGLSGIPNGRRLNCYKALSASPTTDGTSPAAPEGLIIR
jgi:subtilisin family serine protease